MDAPDHAPGDGAGAEPQRPAAPPTVRPEHRPRRATWPMTIGIIALAIGVLSAVVGLWGLATLAWTDTLAPPQMAGDEAAARSFRDMMRWNAVLGLAKAVAAVVLIVGGAFIIQRRLAGARLVMVWSGLKMAIGLVVTYVTFDAQRKMMGG